MTNPGMFSAAEVLDMAIQTERNGKAFYAAAAAVASDPEVRKLMRYLGEAEENHEREFTRMRGASSIEAPAETYPGERDEYVTALLQARVLPDEETGLKAVRNMQDDLEALDFAIAFEKDTILFMYEMRHLLPADEQARVDALIGQEQTHVKVLQDMKTNCSA